MRIYPNQKQKEMLTKCFNASRFVYNKTLEFINNWYTENKKMPNLTNIREKLIHNDSPLVLENPWLVEDFVYDFRDSCMLRCVHNFKTNIAKCKKTKKPFKIHFKSKKLDITPSIDILARYWNPKTERSWWSFTKKLKCRDKRLDNKLPETIDHTCTIIKLQDGNFYVHFPMNDEPKKNNIFEHERIASLDIGVRDMHTIFCPNNNIAITLGKSINIKIARRLHHVRKLQSLCTSKEINHRTRYHIKNRVYPRELQRIQHLIEDYRKTNIKFMCDNFNTILIPKLSFHDIKNLNKKSKSIMATLSHCKFVDDLTIKSRQYENCNVIIVTEEYTSKTCSNCGILKHNLGSSKTFKCNNCNNIFDRDINASKNILLKAIHDKKIELTKVSVVA